MLLADDDSLYGWVERALRSGRAPLRLLLFFFFIALDNCCPVSLGIGTQASSSHDGGTAGRLRNDTADTSRRGQVVPITERGGPTKLNGLGRDCVSDDWID